MTTHGDRRNYRTITETRPVDFKTIDTGQSFTAFNSSSFTGEDHWCEICNEWVAPRGILSAILCPKCNATWDKKFWHSETEPQPEGGWWADDND